MKKQKKVTATKLNFPLHVVAEIEWNDACSLSGWNDEKTYKEHTTMPVKSVGFLMKRDKHHITLVTNQAIDNSFSLCITIPTPWIQGVRILRKGKNHPK